MRTCERVAKFIQVVNEKGDVQVCPWIHDNKIGNLLENSFQEILNNDKAWKYRTMLSEKDFSNCPIQNCPYLANGSIEEHFVELDESQVLYPERIALGYEGKCNYSCIFCSSHDHIKDARKNDYTDNIRVIEGKLREVLPYAKYLSAHGCGELFSSPSIMRLLSEWKPISPSDEISVGLETNGSLFNKNNWQKIENLGQYHLTVSITVSSFQEETYQFLSGTSLPIRNIEENLLFIKKLRETNIINDLCLATVVNELNFREMPKFVKRCIEDFGADRVRVRPIHSSGSMESFAEWFMDVRNPYHPYFPLYNKVMCDPIFNDDKVLKWSGDLTSDRGIFEPKICVSKNTEKDTAILKIVTAILETNSSISEVLEINDKNIAIYGLGVVGRALLSIISEKCNTIKIFDRRFTELSNEKYDVEKFEGIGSLGNISVIIVTVFGEYEDIKKNILNTGYSGRIINIFDIKWGK